MRHHAYPLLAVLLGLLAVMIEPAGAARLTEQCGCVEPIDSAVQNVFAAHPQGGSELAAAIEELLKSHPELAEDVICASQGAPVAQQTSAGAGYARAQLALASSDPDSAAAMADGAQCGDREFRTAYLATQSSFAFIPRVFGPGFGGGVVSQNEPFTD